MTQKEPRTSAKPGMPNVDPAQFADMGKKQVDAMVGMQREFMDAFEEMNRAWADRAKAETALVTEFAAKFAAARTIPDTTAICQEWLSRRMELFAEDSRRLVADSQKFVAASTRVLSKGWTGGSS